MLFKLGVQIHDFVIPAKAGIQWALVGARKMDAQPGFPLSRE